MKKVNLNGKLSLKKETIAKLNNDQMGAIKGGITNISQNNYTCTPNTQGNVASCHIECVPFP